MKRTFLGVATIAGLVDFARIDSRLMRIKGQIITRRLERLTPFAAPLLLEVGKVPVKGAAEESLLAEETAALMQSAGLA